MHVYVFIFLSRIKFQGTTSVPVARGRNRRQVSSVVKIIENPSSSLLMNTSRDLSLLIPIFRDTRASARHNKRQNGNRFNIRPINA